MATNFSPSGGSPRRLHCHPNRLGPILTQTAGLLEPTADGHKSLTRGRCCSTPPIGSPAEGRAVSLQAARRFGPYGHSCQSHAFRWCRLPVIVLAPADGGPAVAQPASVAVPSDDVYKCLPAWDPGLSVVVVFPADRGAVGTPGAGMFQAAADGYEPFVNRSRRLTAVILTPTDRRPIRTRGAGVACTTAD